MKLSFEHGDRKGVVEKLFLPIEEFSGEREENPFTTEQGAEEWSASVENERGLWRDTVLYPMMRGWIESSSTTSPIVLDIGSGQGRSSIEIDGYGAYIGVEPSRFLVQRAKSLYSRDDRFFVEGNAYQLPIVSEAVDGALMVNVLFHLEHPDRAIAELARVLKSGGRFFLNTVNFDAIDVWKSFYTNVTMDEKKMQGSIPTPERSLSSNTLYFQSNEGIEASLRARGLRIDRITKSGGKDGKPLFVTYEGVKEEVPAV